MPNITLAIDEKLLKQVRSYARRNGSTVNGLVRKNLMDLVEGERRGSKRLVEEKADRSADIQIPAELMGELSNLASARKTTVSALICEYLAELADRRKRAREAMAKLKEMSLRSKSDLGPDYEFDRESIYER